MDLLRQRVGAGVQELVVARLDELLSRSSGNLSWILTR